RDDTPHEERAGGPVNAADAVDCRRVYADQHLTDAHGGLADLLDSHDRVSCHAGSVACPERPDESVTSIGRRARWPPGGRTKFVLHAGRPAAATVSRAADAEGTCTDRGDHGVARRLTGGEH